MLTKRFLYGIVGGHLHRHRPEPQLSPCRPLARVLPRGKKVLKRTIANLSEVPRNIVEGLRILLRGGTAVERFQDSFEIERSLPHGHVAAVLGTLRKLKLDTLIDSEFEPPSFERGSRIRATIIPITRLRSSDGSPTASEPRSPQTARGPARTPPYPG